MNKNILTHINYIYKNSFADVLFTQHTHPEKRKLIYNTGLFYAKASSFSKDMFLQLFHEMEKNALTSIDPIDFIDAKKYNFPRLMGSKKDL